MAYWNGKCLYLWIMKIAVPTFGQRISPRFDCTNEIIIVEIQNRRIVDRKILFTAQLSAFEKIKIIRDLEIDVMICGGIDRDSEQRLWNCRILVKAWLQGDAMKLLDDFIKGLYV